MSQETEILQTHQLYSSWLCMSDEYTPVLQAPVQGREPRSLQIIHCRKCIILAESLQIDTHSATSSTSDLSEVMQITLAMLCSLDLKRRSNDDAEKVKTSFISCQQNNNVYAGRNMHKDGL